jgi:3-dehydroquinate synthetase
MAEVIKYGLIRDEIFFYWLEKNIEGLMKLNPSLLIEAIQSAHVKTKRMWWRWTNTNQV